MKLALLTITTLLIANHEPIYKDEPIIKKFIDNDYICTSEELEKASKMFMKCDNTPVFRDCYKKMIKENCTYKLF